MNKCNCKCCDGKTVATAATAIAIALSENLTDDEQVVIGSLLTQVADMLLAINAVNSLCGTEDENAIAAEVAAV